jgi:hypothetical protein
MKRIGWLSLLAMISACHHEDTAALSQVSVPGYWFLLIFVVAPLIVILVKTFMDLSAIRESLFGIESQFRRLNSRLDELEEKIKPPAPAPAKPKNKGENKKEE